MLLKVRLYFGVYKNLFVLYFLSKTMNSELIFFSFDNKKSNNDIGGDTLNITHIDI